MPPCTSGLLPARCRSANSRAPTYIRRRPDDRTEHGARRALRQVAEAGLLDVVTRAVVDFGFQVDAPNIVRRVCAPASLALGDDCDNDHVIRVAGRRRASGATDHSGALDQSAKAPRRTTLGVVI
ncbi:hypothetical protein GCM10009565_42580 [Amycolatopsis albidoflavus]